MTSTLVESEMLRLQLQQIAHQQRARILERRLQTGLQRRVREWNETVHRYMDAVRLLDELHATAVRAFRTEQLAGCVEAANMEIERVRKRFALVNETLGSLSGVNINAESIEMVCIAFLFIYQTLHNRPFCSRYAAIRNASRSCPQIWQTSCKVVNTLIKAKRFASSKRN